MSPSDRRDRVRAAPDFRRRLGPLLAASLAGVLLLLPAPPRARGEACTAEIPLSIRDTATSDLVVVPGRSIGPIAIGMTERQVSHVARRIDRRSRSGGRLQRWRTPSAEVDVMFSRQARVRLLRASSNRLTVEGTPLAAGPAAVAAHLSGYNRADCRDHVEFQSAIGDGRSTALVLPNSPGRVAVVTILDLRASRR